MKLLSALLQSEQPVSSSKILGRTTPAKRQPEACWSRTWTIS